MNSGSFVAQLESISTWLDEVMGDAYDEAVQSFTLSLRPSQSEDEDWANNPDKFLPACEPSLKLVGSAKPVNPEALVHMAAKNRKDSDRIVISGLALLDACRVVAAKVVAAPVPVLPEERQATPLSFSNLTVGHHHAKQLQYLKDYAKAAGELDKFWKENKDTIEKKDFSCTSGTSRKSMM